MFRKLRIVLRIKGNLTYTVNARSLKRVMLGLTALLMSGVIFISLDEVSALLAGKLTMYVSMIASPKAAIDTLTQQDNSTVPEDVKDGTHKLPEVSALLAGKLTMYVSMIASPKAAIDTLTQQDNSTVPEDVKDGTHKLPLPTDKNPPQNTEIGGSSDSAEASSIPKKYQAQVVEELLAPSYNEALYAKHNNIMIRNYTKHSPQSIEDILTEGFNGSYKGEKPIVLIYHTHATESYEKYDSNIYDTRNTWRDQDNTNNVVDVGKALADELEKLGVEVIHDTTQHDFPSYTGAYTRSRKTIDEYLKKYPNIAITLDIHRDGIVREDDTVVKPVVSYNGEKYAQIMMVAPCQSDTVKAPNWKENLRFAVMLQGQMESQLKNICRPILLDYRKYNLDATPASLLIEVGSNGNTLEEAKRSIRLMAKPIAQILDSAFAQE